MDEVSLMSAFEHSYVKEGRKEWSTGRRFSIEAVDIVEKAHKKSIISEEYKLMQVW